IDVKVDFKLVASQINGTYEPSKDSMIKYPAKARKYVSGFKSFSIENIPRNMNQKVDVLIVRKAIRKGYYWPTMHEDAKKEVEKCNPCQVHAPVPRLPKTIMTPIMAPWPFYQLGMDILGPLSPTRGGAKFVIVAIDYFTKWIEAKPLVKITGKEVIRFAMDNIICRFGLPRVIVTDNEAQLERREAAAIREAKYKLQTLEQYYNRKVCLAGFRPGEFVFRRNKASRVEDQGKLGPKWEGPYRVVEAIHDNEQKFKRKQALKGGAVRTREEQKLKGLSLMKACEAEFVREEENQDKILENQRQIGGNHEKSSLHRDIVSQTTYHTQPASSYQHGRQHLPSFP
nr:reverse transcriptase domain-containing protein [Tanacetum cinerariifolium]